MVENIKRATSILESVLRTMDTISVTGIDNQDKFVGCANAISTAITHLENLAAQENEPKVTAEEGTDG